MLPTGDGESSYSPHALQGRISAVEAGQLTVQVDGGDIVVIETPPETKLYKLAGGVVLRQELMAGHRVRVWFDSPGDGTGSTPRRAAVILLASLDPADHWPPG